MKPIVITNYDMERLRKLIEQYKTRRKANENIMKLEEELSRAKMVSQYDVSNTVITLNSTVKCRMIPSNEEKTYTIVFPHAADYNKNKISILSPIAISLIGYSVGDIIEWDVPAGKIQIEVIEILYQPEASGDFTL